MPAIVHSSADTPPETRLGAQAIADFLAQRLADDVVETDVSYEQATVTVKPAALERAARLCKLEPSLAMDFFDMMAGVDLAEQGFAVVTRLYSTKHRHEVLLRVVAEGGREDPRVPSISGVYRGADWHERETYDMFGITFEGHPNLLPRILTVENFEGWPLRKEFLLMTREAKPWPGLKEPKEEEPAEGGGEDGAGAGPTAEEKAAAAKAKAERAKKKAAEMRAKKAAERAAQQKESGGSDPDPKDGDGS
jgi:NADH:ubiquinone oxidoreductase subunit C